MAGPGLGVHGSLGLCGLLSRSDGAWGFLLLGSWRCASPHHLVFVNFAVWALFSGPFLLCPGDEIVVLHGLVCSAQQELLGFLSFCADGSPLSSSAWWDYGVPVLLIRTPCGITQTYICYKRLTQGQYPKCRQEAKKSQSVYNI